MAQTTEQWLSEKISNYAADGRQTIENMLIITTEVLKQYLDNEDSKATKGLLEACLKHNSLFIKNVLDYEM